jgi:hypothetical protein
MAAILPNHWRPPITAGQRHVLHSGTPQARRGRGATTLVPWSRTVRTRACPRAAADRCTACLPSTYVAASRFPHTLVYALAEHHRRLQELHGSPADLRPAGLVFGYGDGSARTAVAAKRCCQRLGEITDHGLDLVRPKGFEPLTF